MTAPATLQEWEALRPELRATLWGLLGELPPVFTPQAETVQIISRARYTIEKVMFDNGAGAAVYGYLLLPHRRADPAPAVLYHHYHGGRYDLGKNEMFQDRVIMPPIGPALAEAGYVVLAIDCYGFGERQNQGPAGDAEEGRETEHALFKRFLWEGRTLWGMIVRDDLLALEYLLTRPEVDPQRIAATGMSLGASRTTWLSALDDRIAVTIPVAQMTRYRDFLAAGRMNGHSVYYFVPGALASGVDMEHLASLTAPRPQLVLIGDADPLSPIEGVRKVDAFTNQVYDLYHAAEHFETVIYPDLGHTYTPAMFGALMEMLGKYL